MSISKEERDQWRERLSSPYTCFEAAHADFTLRLLHELEEVERELIGRRKECEEVEQTLGKALGYPPYPVLNGMDYSQIPASKTNAQDSPWVNIGDHVPGTIAEESAQRIAKLEREADWLATKLNEIASPCRTLHPCEGSPSCNYPDGEPRCWRDVAHKAVEEWR